MQINWERCIVGPLGVTMRRALGVVMLFLVATAFALDVDEQELQELLRGLREALSDRS